MEEYLAPLWVVEKEEAIVSVGRQGLPGKMKAECVHRRILDVARKQGDTVGKWVLWPSVDKVGSWRTRIARATVNGRIVCGAKVSASAHCNHHSSSLSAGAASDGGTPLIYLYVKDFDDKVEVKRVLQVELGLPVTTALGFQPDAFTALGIQQGSNSPPWRIRPTTMDGRGSAQTVRLARAIDDD